MPGAGRRTLARPWQRRGGALTGQWCHDSPVERVAVVLPGRGYTPARPLLHFARRVLECNGWTVRELWWQPPMLPEYGRWVREQTLTALAGPPPATLLIGKSLGTLAAQLAAERALPAVWLTPLMSNATVVKGIAAATAPVLLVGGTGDVLWDSAAAHASGHQVFEAEDADHSLETSDPAQSVQILHRYTEHLTRFIAAL